MGVTDIICEYIYESFKDIKAWLEKFEETMKDKIKSLLKAVNAMNIVIKKTIGPLVDKLNDALESIRKSIKPLILDIPGKLPFICDDLWKCLALLQELLKDTSALYRSLKSGSEEKCLSEEEKNIFDHMDSMITDYTKFRDIVCNLGFNFDFCISAMKMSLKTFKLQGINYQKMLNKKFKFFDGQLNTIVRFSINAGLGSYLDKLIEFFECAFGADFPDLNFSLNGEIDLNPCAEIATAQNFFNEVLSVCHLIQEGDGYVIDPEFKAYIFSTIEGMMSQVQMFLDNIDKLNEICINSTELRVATKSYENSKNVWPGDVSFSDIKNAYNSAKNFKWQKVNIIKYYSTKYSDIVEAFVEKKNKETKLDECIPDNTTQKSIKKPFGLGTLGDLLNVEASTNLPTTTVDTVANAVGIKSHLSDSKYTNGGLEITTGNAIAREEKRDAIQDAIRNDDQLSLEEAIFNNAPRAVRQNSNPEYNESLVNETNENMTKAKLTISLANKGVKTVNTDKYAELPVSKYKRTEIDKNTGVPYEFKHKNNGVFFSGAKGLINKPSVQAKIAELHKAHPEAKTLNDLNKKFKTTRYNKHYILKNIKIDDDGVVTIQDGCCNYVLDNLKPLSEPIVYDMLAGDISDNSTILDPATDEVISVSEAAVKIACDPTSDLATRCKEIWNTINNLYDEQNIVQKY